ncbi:MAG: 5-oxoprolinase subunit PxpA [Rhodobacteraceae bacterium]|nr:5-oxoprolinase subunit PxpA [Paracoccaceae bacterium]MCY4250916.1 5-oxoprolinase subunit PxpA [Paracoccaceae bacterium]MCY4307088.1 5-oxoprolinase subunit PxpA [Paracoccaceae bacterium]
MKPLINCDMGESFGLYKIGEDDKLMPLISMANVACGFHGSDANHMRKTVQLAKENNVKVGAHPSLPDLQGFGRREMKISRKELANILIYQIGALVGMLKAENYELNHIKPHGALYGMAARDESVAHAICDAADVYRVPLIGMVNTCHERVYKSRGHDFLAEFYADLNYNDDGTLIITMKHEPVPPEEVEQRCTMAFKENKTFSVNGKEVLVGCDCICVHSDTPNAVEIAMVAKRTLQAL